MTGKLEAQDHCQTRVWTLSPEQRGGCTTAMECGHVPTEFLRRMNTLPNCGHAIRHTGGCNPTAHSANGQAGSCAGDWVWPSDYLQVFSDSGSHFVLPGSMAFLGVGSVKFCSELQSPCSIEPRALGSCWTEEHDACSTVNLLSRPGYWPSDVAGAVCMGIDMLLLAGGEHVSIATVTTRSLEVAVVMCQFLQCICNSRPCFQAGLRYSYGALQRQIVLPGMSTFTDDGSNKFCANTCAFEKGLSVFHRGLKALCEKGQRGGSGKTLSHVPSESKPAAKAESSGQRGGSGVFPLGHVPSASVEVDKHKGRLHLTIATGQRGGSGEPPWSHVPSASRLDGAQTITAGQRGGSGINGRLVLGHVPSESSSADEGRRGSGQSRFRSSDRTWVLEARCWFELKMVQSHHWCGTMLLILASLLREYLTAFFRTGALCLLVYMGRLLSFSFRLQGGNYNVDNIVRLSRNACRGMPWHLGMTLSAFSPRLNAVRAQDRRGGRKLRSGIRFSSDFWLLLFLLSSCFGRALAARGWRYPSTPRYPSLDMSGYRFDMRMEALRAQREAAAGDWGPDSDSNSEADEEVESSSSIDSSPPRPRSPMPHYVPRSFRIIAYAHRPEFLAASFREGGTLDRSLELLEVDSILANQCGQGYFVAQQGMPITEDFHILWVPAWMPYTTGCIVVFEAALLSLGTFACHIPNRLLNRDLVRTLVPEIGEQEYHVFVPAKRQGPVASDETIVLDIGDVVHLQPDPMGPFVHENNATAYDEFPLWGTDEFFDGFDRPWGRQLILIVGIDTPVMLDFIPEEEEHETIQRVCLQLGISDIGMSLLWPRQVFFELAHNGLPVVKVACLLCSPLRDFEVVTFVDGRLVMQSITAVRLPCSLLPKGDIADLLRIEVRVVAGFQLWIEGGQRVAGDLVVHSGGTLRPQLVPDNAEFVSSQEEPSDPGSDCETRPEEEDHDQFASEDGGPHAPPMEQIEQPSEEAASSILTDGARSTGASASHWQCAVPWGRSYVSRDVEPPKVRHAPGMAMADMWNLTLTNAGALRIGGTGDTSTDIAAPRRLHASRQSNSRYC